MSHDNDDDDADLATAIALSLQPEASSPHVLSTASNQTTTDTTSESVTAAQSLTLAKKLDFKAFEADRVARRNLKRQRSISPPAINDTRKTMRLSEHTTILPSGCAIKSFSTLDTSENQQSKRSENGTIAKPITISSATMKDDSAGQTSSPIQATASASTKKPSSSLMYPRGVVKKTWAFGHPRDGHDIKIEEVFEASTLKIAVLSAYEWDLDWVLSKLNTPEKGGKTKCVLIMQAKGDEARATMLHDAAPYSHFMRVCLPPMHNLVFCMHSKLMLLFHPNKLRIVVPSANLRSFDWGEDGTMENSVFLIDLPRLAQGSTKSEMETLPHFAQDLAFFLEKQGVHEDVRQGFLGFDFAATQDMAFVHTVGGTSFRQNAQRTGLPGLARAVRQLGLQTSNLELDFAASSCGKLDDKYLQHLHAAARGEDVIDFVSTSRTQSARNFFQPHVSDRSTQSNVDGRVNLSEKFRIYFPTDESVRDSKAGVCGSVCMQRKYWETKGYPRTCFRDYRSTRIGLLSHNKILLGRGILSLNQEKLNNTGTQKVAWVYVGSANMSKSAWGEVQQSSRYNDWQVLGRNWECGVLLPVRSLNIAGTQHTAPTMRSQEHEDSDTEVEEEDVEKEQSMNEKLTDRSSLSIGMEVFKEVLDVPFQVPGPRYGDRHPYYFEEDPALRRSN